MHSVLGSAMRTIFTPSCIGKVPSKHACPESRHKLIRELKAHLLQAEPPIVQQTVDDGLLDCTVIKISDMPGTFWVPAFQHTVSIEGRQATLDNKYACF